MIKGTNLEHWIDSIKMKTFFGEPTDSKKVAEPKKKVRRKKTKKT